MSIFHFLAYSDASKNTSVYSG